MTRHWPRSGVVVLTFLLTLAAPLFAWNEPDGFRGVPWGASREELRAHLQPEQPKERWQPRLDAVTCYGPGVGCKGSVTIGPLSVDAHYMFAPDADKFESVGLSFAPDNYETLRGIFTERYGKPSSIQKEVVQNRMGAKFTDETAFWNGKRVNIILSRYGSNLDRGFAKIGLKAAEDRDREESQKAIKKGKDDL